MKTDEVSLEKTLSQHWVLIISVLEIYAFYPVADTSEHLVWYGVEHVGEYGYGQIVTEYLHGVALMAVYARDIYHRNVHTYIAHILRTLASYDTVAVAVAQFAVQSVGISYRYGG